MTQTNEFFLVKELMCKTNKDVIKKYLISIICNNDYMSKPSHVDALMIQNYSPFADHGSTRLRVLFLILAEESWL